MPNSHADIRPTDKKTDAGLRGAVVPEHRKSVTKPVQVKPTQWKFLKARNG